MVLKLYSDLTIKQLNIMISDTADSDENELDESTAASTSEQLEPDPQPNNKADKEIPKGNGDPDLPKITFKRKRSHTSNVTKVAKTKQPESVLDKTIASFLQY